MPADSGDDESDDAPDGSIPLGDVFETLSELLDRLDDVDLEAGERRSGSRERDGVSFDYSVNIGSINPAGESRRNRRQRDWNIRGESDDHEYRVRVEEQKGRLVVVADLPAVSADEIDIGTTDGGDTLEIRVDGDIVESVPLDSPGASVTDVTFTNQVLEVEVEPSEAGGDDTTETDK
jgi:HSP20 family molecular chaperone IbpA